MFEIELEYESAVNAIQTAKRRCDNINLGIETTISSAPAESRRFQRVLSYAAHLDESSTGLKSQASKYLKLLFSLNLEKSDRAVLEDQFARHDLILDRITTFLISDSNAILKDLATIDEHLRAIKEIARRENERLGNGNCDPESDTEAEGPLASMLKVFRLNVDNTLGKYINLNKESCDTSEEQQAVPLVLKTLLEARKPTKSLTEIFEKLVKELQAVRAEWEAGSRLMHGKKSS